MFCIKPISVCGFTAGSHSHEVLPKYHCLDKMSYIYSFSPADLVISITMHYQDRSTNILSHKPTNSLSPCLAVIMPIDWIIKRSLQIFFQNIIYRTPLTSSALIGGHSAFGFHSDHIQNCHFCQQKPAVDGVLIAPNTFGPLFDSNIR